jgi:hypothetical protein
MAQGATRNAENIRPERKETTERKEDSLVGFLTKWNAEITRFYVSRYQRYWTIPIQLLSCTSSEDIKALQAEFKHELFEDYRAEASRLARIANETLDLPRPSESDYAASLLKAQRDANAIIEQAKLQAERIVASAQKRADLPEQTAEEITRKKRA